MRASSDQINEVFNLPSTNPSDRCIRKTVDTAIPVPLSPLFRVWRRWGKACANRVTLGGIGLLAGLFLRHCPAADPRPFLR
jgi:hypothetical protein